MLHTSSAGHHRVRLPVRRRASSRSASCTSNLGLELIGPHGPANLREPLRRSVPAPSAPAHVQNVAGSGRYGPRAVEVGAPLGHLQLRLPGEGALRGCAGSGTLARDQLSASYRACLCPTPVGRAPSPADPRGLRHDTLLEDLALGRGRGRLELTSTAYARRIVLRPRRPGPRIERAPRERHIPLRQRAGVSHPPLPLAQRPRDRICALAWSSARALGDP